MNRQFAVAFALVLASINPASADPRPGGVTGETWQFGPLNRWAYTHLREILPTKTFRTTTVRCGRCPASKPPATS